MNVITACVSSVGLTPNFTVHRGITTRRVIYLFIWRTVLSLWNVIKQVWIQILSRAPWPAIHNFPTYQSILPYIPWRGRTRRCLFDQGHSLLKTRECSPEAQDYIHWPAARSYLSISSCSSLLQFWVICPFLQLHKLVLPKFLLSWGR